MMRVFDSRELSKCQVGALHECSDFVLNGYSVVLSCCQDPKWFIKLRHRRNGRILIIEVSRDRYLIREGKTILKQVPV